MLLSLSFSMSRSSLVGIDADQMAHAQQALPVIAFSVAIRPTYCPADIIAPEWSEHVSDLCVRHVWSCEACGYQFEDTVYLSRDPVPLMLTCSFFKSQ